MHQRRTAQRGEDATRDEKKDVPDQSAAPAVTDIRSSTRFLLLRSFLLLLIFGVLHTLTQWYVLEPMFQPHRTKAFQEKAAEAMRQQIAAQACPSGMDCSFTLKDEWKV